MQKDSNETHKEFKKRVFDDLDGEVSRHDVIIYTGTLSAGVDCQIPVERVIGWYSKRTSDAMQFVQGLYRFRNHKSMTLYIFKSSSVVTVTPFALCPNRYHSILGNNFQEQMLIWLEARTQCIQASSL